MKVRLALVGFVISAALVGCGSTPVAAPVTTTATSVITSAVAATVLESTTVSVTETVGGVRHSVG